MFRRFPKIFLPALFITLIATSPTVKAETSVHIQLERMLSSKETANMRGIPVGKVDKERPSFMCKGKSETISVYTAMFRGNKQLTANVSGKLACGGKRSIIKPNALMELIKPTLSRMKGAKKYSTNFFPGDQFLPKINFTSRDYKSGAFIKPLSRKLRMSFKSKTWFLITAISSSRKQVVRSTPWIIIGKD